jgi:wyosine [tRNA(Phe)-imidazoG37] synthetase (radical SAM superfamily)
MRTLTAVHSDRSGDLFVGEDYVAAGYDGLRERPLEEAATIPLPAGASLMAMDSRRAQAFDRHGRLRTLGRERWALGALLPTGYTRTAYPAYADDPARPDLPLFGYTAVAMLDGELRTAAVATDPAPEWDPAAFNTPDLRARVNDALRAHPSNRMLRQLARCAREYGCYTAQNVFYGRWEAALPVSPACNAHCVGCISLQEGATASPQERFRVTPSAEEIAEIATAHLQRPEATIVSFGQGCEGEPLLAARTIAEAIQQIRQRTSRGVLHLNTNGSLSAQLRRLIDAGLQSIRVSTISAIARTYEAYYRPENYRWSDVRASLQLAAEREVLININLLVLPGLTDRPEEVDAFVALLRELPGGVVQLRNLNADPRRALAVFERPRELLGIPGALERFRDQAPAFALRSFTRPVPVSA